LRKFVARISLRHCRTRLPSDPGMGNRLQTPQKKLASPKTGDTGQNTIRTRLASGPQRDTTALLPAGPASRTVYIPFQESPTRFTLRPVACAAAI
jgi:hypothetical protein